MEDTSNIVGKWIWETGECVDESRALDEWMGSGWWCSFTLHHHVITVRGHDVGGAARLNATDEQLGRAPAQSGAGDLQHFF